MPSSSLNKFYIDFTNMLSPVNKACVLCPTSEHSFKSVVLHQALQSLDRTQRRRDEAVIPGVATHRLVCNPQNYTNLLCNWLNLQIRLVLQHQPDKAYSSEQTQKCAVYIQTNKWLTGFGWAEVLIRGEGSVYEQACVCFLLDFNQCF